MRIIVVTRFVRGRVGPLVFKKKSELLQGLNVADDNPVLRGVLTVMETMQQECIDAGNVKGLPADEAKAELRCVNCLQNLEERLFSTTKEARNSFN